MTERESQRRIYLGFYILYISCSNKTYYYTFNGPFFRDYPPVPERYNTNMHFTEARDSEWQWHQLGHAYASLRLASLQTDNHASTPPTPQFLQTGCPFCRQGNSVKALIYIAYQLNSLKSMASFKCVIFLTLLKCVLPFYARASAKSVYPIRTDSKSAKQCDDSAINVTSTNFHTALTHGPLPRGSLALQRSNLLPVFDVLGNAANKQQTRRARKFKWPFPQR